MSGRTTPVLTRLIIDPFSRNDAVERGAQATGCWVGQLAQPFITPFFPALDCEPQFGGTRSFDEPSKTARGPRALPRQRHRRRRISPFRSRRGDETETCPSMRFGIRILTSAATICRHAE